MCQLQLVNLVDAWQALLVLDNNSWKKHIPPETFVISEFLKRQLKMGAGSKEVATIEALPDKVNGTTTTKNQSVLSAFGRVLSDEFWDIKGTVKNT